MGWSGGTDIVREMAKAIKENVKGHSARLVLYQTLVDSCESNDWDCQDEAMGIDPILDKVLSHE
jgi:hypothetical protein